MNGHVFVNNVSLGLYAEIVQSPEYRDTKVDTTLSALPQLLGPGSQPMDLRFEGPGRHGATTAPTSSRCRTGPTERRWRRSPAVLASTPASSGSSLWFFPTTPPRSVSSARSRPTGPTGTRASRSGRAASSSSIRRCDRGGARRRSDADGAAAPVLDPPTCAPRAARAQCDRRFARRPRPSHA